MSDVLYDADFIIALLIPAESTHEKAVDLYRRWGVHQAFLLDIVRYEIVTVVSRKYDAPTARLAWDRTIPTHFRTIRAAELEDKAEKEFLSHHKKSISFFDCANLVAAKHYDLKIASFDKFYPKEMIAA